MFVRKTACLWLLSLTSAALAVALTAEAQQLTGKAKANPARLKGMKAAIADIETGKLRQKSPPLPDPPWHGRYVELLKKEYGIEWVTVDGNVPNEALAELG